MILYSRRRFTQTASAAVFSSLALARETPAADAKMPVCVFNKPLQHLNYEEQANLVAEMGFVGIEGTVRTNGHVTPERVKKDLPDQIKALRKNGVEMTLMTTDINNTDDEVHRRVLETAASLGVTQFRMGSIKFTFDRPIQEQLDEIKVTFEKLVDFCQPLGIQPLYQNHAGVGRFGAALWDVYEVIKGYDPNDVGIAFDIRHAVVEGGQSWPTEFHLLRPWFGFVYCKDFEWEDGNQKPSNVPLTTGQVDYPLFFKTLEKSDYTGPISLHMEYINHKDPMLLDESIAAIKADKKNLDALIRG
jgi:sugar phosphate isomerase/epimerase|tara:strand:+ start:22384 stop:23292 length:909 start_codon:yes stop_codon:yes gene_type:complete